MTVSNVGYVYAMLICFVFNGEVPSTDAMLHKREDRPSQCSDKYSIIERHTMCLAERQNPLLNKTVTDRIVSLHNEARRNVTPPATNMINLVYVSDLAEEAQLWAEQCAMNHDQGYQRFQPGRYIVGQNLASLVGSEMTWKRVVDLWNSEKAKFTYGGPGNVLHEVGHYTQVVWAETQGVGCGMAKCDNTYYYVCNYAPSGNYNGLDTPYERASSPSDTCSKCPGHCDSSGKNCDCNGVVCLNEGKLNLATCQCECIQAVSTYDPTNNCELTCEEEGDESLCGTVPWDAASCPGNPSALFHCPWLCRVCPYAGKNYTEGELPLSGNGSSSSLAVSTGLITGVLVCLHTIIH